MGAGHEAAERRNREYAATSTREHVGEEGTGQTSRRGDVGCNEGVQLSRFGGRKRPRQADGGIVDENVAIELLA